MTHQITRLVVVPTFHGNIRVIENEGGPWCRAEDAEAILAELEALTAHVERLSKAALDAIHYLPGGDIKAELRDAYDELRRHPVP